jgi:hypothetical protein
MTSLLKGRAAPMETGSANGSHQPWHQIVMAWPTSSGPYILDVPNIGLWVSWAVSTGRR